MAGTRAKPIRWLHGEVKSPPFSDTARQTAGELLRRLQHGETIGLPRSRTMPTIAPRCHELRVPDETATWRIIYRTDPDAVLVLAVFSKKTQATPRDVIVACQRRIREYDTG